MVTGTGVIVIAHGAAPAREGTATAAAATRPTAAAVALLSPHTTIGLAAHPRAMAPPCSWLA